MFVRATKIVYNYEGMILTVTMEPVHTNNKEIIGREIYTIL